MIYTVAGRSPGGAAWKKFWTTGAGQGGSAAASHVRAGLPLPAVPGVPDLSLLSPRSRPEGRARAVPG